MKATFTLLAALVVSACSLSAARAQNPIMLTGHGASGVVAGGCGSGNCGGGCSSGNCGHKPSLFTKLFHKDCGGGCNSRANDGCGKKCAICSWLCRPLPSNAPSCFKADYPLGFPNSPYVRSPRDYFMTEQPGYGHGYGFGAGYGY